MRVIEIQAQPSPVKLDLAKTALIIIDMQTDFCGERGYVDRMGYDLALTRAPIEPIKAVLAAMRDGGYTIFHTREGHRPDLADLLLVAVTETVTSDDIDRLDAGLREVLPRELLR